MKRIKKLFFTFLFTGAAAYAALEDNFGSIEPIDPQEINEHHPFEFRVNYDYIGYSKFDKTLFKGDSSRFSIGNIAGDFIFYHSDACREGALIEVGYSRAEIGWKDNPFFHENRFNSLDVALGMYSQRFCDWMWQLKAGFAYGFDHGSFFDYTTYDLLAWGRYSYRENIGVHLGFYAETGLRIDRVYPVIGFDWTFNKCWKLNMIFPLNMGIVYTVNECWTASLASRIFSFRHRLGKDEPISEGLVSYRNAGVEFRVDFNKEHRVTANVHAGYTVGGMLKIANKQYEDKMHLPVKPAAYLGAEFSFSI